MVSSGGNDSNTGLSENAPWKSPGRINTAMSAGTIRPGDTILFKRGEVFTGNLEISVSGSPESPLRFDVFGEGEKPVLDAVSHHNGVVMKASHIELSNLHISNARENAFFFTGDISDVKISGCDVFNTSPISTSNGFTFSDGIFSGATISDVRICGQTDFGIYTTSETRLSKVTFDKISADSGCYGFYAYGSTLEDVEITGCRFNGNFNSGIKLVSVTAERLSIDNCIASNNTVHGVYVNGTVSDVKITGLTVDSSGSVGLYIDTVSAKNILIDDSRITGSKNERNGLALDGKGETCVIRNTVASNNKGDGFNVHGSWKNIRLIECTADNNGNDGKGWDGDGYTFHDDSTGSMIRCTAANNRKSAVAHVHESQLALEYCIFTHETNGTIPLVLLSGRKYSVKNCVLYSPSQKGTGLSCSTGDIEVINTIVYGFNVGFENRKARLKNNFNCVFGAGTDNWKGISSGANSISADPLFTSPAALDFTLRKNSPCIDSGTDTSLQRDFTGTAVPDGGKPDIGAFEFSR